MATQFFIAHSTIMKGVGIIAGGPYLCAQSWPARTYMENTINTCMNPRTASLSPNTPRLVKKTRLLAKNGKIDSVENLYKKRVYLFSGTNDRTVNTRVMDQTLVFYQALGVKSDAIFYNKTTNAGHGIITDNDSDNPCSTSQPPYINNCDIPQAKKILGWIYPGLETSQPEPKAKAIPFNQAEFIHNPYTSLDDTGYVYIPKQCHNQIRCSIHIVFHGCEQGAAIIGDRYYNHTGYNTYADANNLIILYPQIRPSTSNPYNPKGCWDFWGYTSPNNPGPDYFSKNAPQISTVYRMVTRLSSHP
ncbi:hypothetical protein VA7868_00368 [Vibrio aerogenes CECT 7868]|uniref:Esterase PHB depolymerase n=2 Tax=Vibrio aerogenes TaxID=92172 RepID=A0A1M5VF46_9VIBR|nr:hypothetical protein VA7868_00368 [Vibrio aerogenes CECT 7868]